MYNIDEVISIPHCVELSIVHSIDEFGRGCLNGIHVRFGIWAGLQWNKGTGSTRSCLDRSCVQSSAGDEYRASSLD